MSKTLRRFLLIVAVASHTTGLAALSVLTYNVAGNGAADWSTNSPQVQAIGRQLQYLQADIVTFNEIPSDQSWQMTNFVNTWLPGYFVARNSGTDGFIRSVIISRFPINRSRNWLARANLAAFGYDGPFTRDLFEAEIQVPHFEQPVHVFTTHLKAGGDTNDLLRRAAEASAISNYFVATFLQAQTHRLYLLTGDLNEDISRPPSGTHRPIQRLTASPTGLRLTTPRNPFNNDDRTISSSSPFARFDYILPCAALFSNIATSQVFRSDLLNPRPPGLNSADSRTASDHLPVLVIFNNPSDTPFGISSTLRAGESIELTWQTSPGRQYRIESSSNFTAWETVSTNLTAATTNLTWSTTILAPHQFFRIYRLSTP